MYHSRDNTGMTKKNFLDISPDVKYIGEVN